MRTILGKLSQILRRLILMKYKYLFGDAFAVHSSLYFRRNFYVSIEKGGSLTIGKGCFFNNDCSLNCQGIISIGNDCIFGENVKIYDHNHKYKENGIPIKEQGFSTGSVIIGNDCWIGSNVTILNNVEIGDHVVIGANCLLFKSVPSNVVVKCKSELVFSERIAE